MWAPRSGEARVHPHTSRVTQAPALCQALPLLLGILQEADRQTPSVRGLPSPGETDHSHVSDDLHAMKTIKHGTAQTKDRAGGEAPEAYLRRTFDSIPE